MADADQTTRSKPKSGGAAAPASTAETAGRAQRLVRVLRDGARSLLDTRLKQLTAAAVVGLLIVFGVWWSIRSRALPPEERLVQALALLKRRDDHDARHAAKTIAADLRKLGFRDPNFSGGAEYVLGIAAFRNGQEADESDREPFYTRAARYLRECEQQALDDRYRPEWSYALGVSLHELGSFGEAQPLLAEAARAFPPGRADVALRLADIALARKRTAEMRPALKLIDAVLAGRLPRRQRDQTLLQKAQLHLALNQQVKAEAALSQVSDAQAGSQGMRVFRARTRMAIADMLASQLRTAGMSAAVSRVVSAQAETQYRRSMQQLRPVSTSVGLDTLFPRQANYLMGIAAERIAELQTRRSATKFDTAINFFEKTARTFPGTHEAVAASLRAADLYRAAGRNEEALNAYRRALTRASTTDEFHNRWISPGELRSLLTNAWNWWMRRKSFTEAVELSRMMSAALTPVHAQELNAVANREWARELEAEIERRPAADRKRLTRDLLRRRRLAGDSYAKLAERTRTESRYPDFLWISAENYHLGHAFVDALRQITAFINARPRKLLPQALVRRGRILLDLDRLNEARDHFQQVRDTYPTDPAAFEAEYLLGVVNLELQQPEKAETVWRNILASKTLTPEAAEWRMSLFSLARHLFHTARIDREQGESARQANDRKRAIQLRDRATVRWDESIRRFEEYLGRYPRSMRTNDARFLLARALQQRADVEREQLGEAEIENVRNEHRRRMRSFLHRALGEFQQMQSELLKREENGRLGERQNTMLRDVYFEIAHVQYDLGEYEKAIAAYTSAANRYPEDPGVLLAYLQMANCSDRLGDATEALSVLVQAEVILKRLPDRAFDTNKTTLSRREWRQWLQWAKTQRMTQNQARSR